MSQPANQAMGAYIFFLLLTPFLGRLFLLARFGWGSASLQFVFSASPWRRCDGAVLLRG
jgi:hypothetical protein